ncbi:hypothetical protein TNCV_3105191 [Trichonephila clavipes]|nr:hypothetical protein TNCV_3105191 [Trichonephila clavipes]
MIGEVVNFPALQLQERLPYADSTTSFISTRAPLKYCGVLPFDITPTTDGREETKGWIPRASRKLVKFEVKEATAATPREWRGSRHETFERAVVFASFFTNNIFCGIGILNSFNITYI